MQRIAFEKLKTADLFVDAVYESNGATNLNGDEHKADSAP